MESTSREGECIVKRCRVAALLALIAGMVLSRSGQAQQAPPGQDVPPDAEAHLDLNYLPDGHERHKRDVFMPKGAEGKLPLVVWVHCGAWLEGSKNNPPPLFL